MTAAPYDSSPDAVLARAAAYLSLAAFPSAPQVLRELYRVGVAGYTSETEERIVNAEMPQTDNPVWLLVAVTKSLQTDSGLPLELYAGIRRQVSGADPEGFAARLLAACAVTAFDRIQDDPNLFDAEQRRLFRIGVLLAARCALVHEIPETIKAKGLAGQMMLAAISGEEDAWKAVLPPLTRMGRKYARDQATNATEALSEASIALVEAAAEAVRRYQADSAGNELPEAVAKMLTLNSPLIGATVTAVKRNVIDATRKRSRRAAHEDPNTEVLDEPPDEASDAANAPTAPALDCTSDAPFRRVEEIHDAASQVEAFRRAHPRETKRCLEVHRLLLKNPELTVENACRKIGITRRTYSRYLAVLSNTAKQSK